MQFSLFDDSAAVALRNDVIAALERRDAAAARAACTVLADAAHDDEALPGLRRLAAALDGEAAVVRPGAEATWLAAQRAALQDEITPAAQRHLGSGAAHWLAPLWRNLAASAAGLPFDEAQAPVHAAALWLAAGDWAAAVEAAQAIPSWRRIPQPLAWVAEAKLRRLGLAAAWPLLAELAWLAPRRLEALVARAGEPQLSRLAAAFAAGFDPDRGPAAADAEGDPEWAWFPAWLLVEQPALAEALAAAQPSLQRPPERAMRLLVELLGLERQGRQHDLVAARRRLRDLHAGLFAAYLRRR